MSIFSFLFLKIDKDMINAFKLSIIIISLTFSVFTFIKFIILGASDLGFSAKGEVGSQRYGFIYVLSIWLLLMNEEFKYKILKIIFIFLIIIGLLLTFSRSGIVAMLLSLFIYSLYKFKKWIYKPTLKGFYIGLTTILISFFLLIYINYKYPIIFEFFYQRLFSYFENNSTQEIDLDETSSEGYRVFMLKKVMNYVLHNPITGAGFLGVWILFDDQSGSAHGQFVDVIFRTGFFGLFVYLFLLYKILKIHSYYDKGIFWGVLGIIIYGFFHETFKLSHGSFVLAFLISSTLHYNNIKKNANEA
jgi:O-antigen ligase